MLKISSMPSSVFEHQALANLPRLEDARTGDLVGVGFLPCFYPRDDKIVMDPLDSLDLLVKGEDGIVLARAADRPEHVREALSLLWSLTLHGFLHVFAHANAITGHMVWRMEPEDFEENTIHLLRDMGIVVHADPHGTIYEREICDEGIATEALRQAVSLIVPNGLSSAHARRNMLPTARHLVDAFRHRFLAEDVGEVPMPTVELSLHLGL